MFAVMKYIHDNITRRITLCETAELFGYSMEHFSRKFSKFTGMTFGEYVRNYRIQLAAIDILNGKKIVDVAFDYGYDTVGGFNKAFLKMYGCFPNEYKKCARESRLYYERKKSMMRKLSQRCVNLREEVVEKRRFSDRFCFQRCVYFALGGHKSKKKGENCEMWVASGIANVLRNFNPVILPGEIITGFNYSDGKYGRDDLFVPENSARHIEIMKKNGICDEDISDYFETDDFFRSLTFLAGLNFIEDKDIPFTENEKNAAEEWSALGRCICSNHSVIDYEKVIKLGFEGILCEIKALRDENVNRILCDAAETVCTAALTMGEKYVAEARRLLDEGNSEYNKSDLEKIISICSNVPRHPARNFTEAVQSLWFAHIINTWEDAVNANSLGRLDMILYPYYKADIEKGILTEDEAFEIICCLWLKLYLDYDVQQSCVGGVNTDGGCAVNELSYMMLDATEALDIIRCLSVRFSKNTPKDFIKRALEVVGHVQKGVPFFFNDDVMIPALVSKNISLDDARNYTQIGCVETVIPGKSNPHAVTGETNFLKAVEYVLCNGDSMMYPGTFPGLKTGEIEKLATYREFYEAILKQLDRILDLTCSQVKKYSDNCIAPKPYKSLLTEGCMKTGKDFNQKGAKYDYYQIMFGGIPNLADSLAVIKKFVYGEKKYTLKNLKNILMNNYPDETVRLEFINCAAKFGNDIDEVDEIAVALVDHACDELERLSGKYGLSFHAQPFTYLWMIEHGKHCAASADGRRKGEVIAYSVSPMQGRDFNGLTATMKSISKFPTKKTPGTTSAIVEVSPRLFSDRNIELLADVLITAAGMGLSNVQFNTVDADTLEDARVHPENHRNLAVRVSGFSQKFTLLDDELQKHIIARTKHECI